jgi:methyl-accepting chemotaxis protein
MIRGGKRMDSFKDMKIRGKMLTGFLVIAFILAVGGGIGFLSMGKMGTATDIVYEEKVPIMEAALKASIAVVAGRDIMGEYLLHEDLKDRETFRAEFQELEEDYHMWYQAATQGTDSEMFRSHSGDRWAERQGGKRVIAVAVDSEVAKHFSVASGYHDQFVEASHAMMLAHDAMLAMAGEKDELVKDLKTSRNRAQGIILAQDDVQLKFDFMSMKYRAKEYIFQYMDEKHEKEWQDSIRTLKASVASSSLEADSREMVLKALDEYESLALKMVSVIEEIKQLQGEEMAQMMALDEASAKVEEAMSRVEEVATNEMEVAAASADATKSTYNVLVVLGTILAIVLALGIGRLLADSITKPLHRLVRYSKVVASGDITKDIRARTKDELGELYGSFGSMLDNLRNLIIQVQGSAHRVAATSQQLAASSEEMTATTTQVSTTMQQIANGAHGQSRQVESASQEMKRMADMVHQVSRKAQATAETSMKTEETAKVGGEAAKEATAKMNEIHVVVNDSATVVKKLGERSHRIEEIVDLITSIADQTNLLALNAAIEAARAGEHGRGFAVVAEEVRKLAEGSAKAAEEIGGLISAIKEETDRAVESMEKGTKEVAEGKEIVNKALASLEEIVGAVNETVANVQEISNATQEQTALTESVVKAMEAIAATAEETAAGTEEASAAAEEQTASMEEISSSAQELSNLALQLQEATSRFKVNGGDVQEKPELREPLSLPVEELRVSSEASMIHALEAEAMATNGGTRRKKGQ